MDHTVESHPFLDDQLAHMRLTHSITLSYPSTRSRADEAKSGARDDGGLSVTVTFSSAGSPGLGAGVETAGPAVAQIDRQT
jgi:hypothetical protein